MMAFSPTHFSLLIIIAVFLFFCSAEAQETGWSGCNSPDKDVLITKGKQTTVCLVLSESGDWNTTGTFEYDRYMFTPTADEFSSLQMTKSSSRPAMHLESQQQLSFIRLTRKDDFIFPIWTAVITVEKGVVTGVTWDLSCTQCSSSNGGKCIDNMYNFHFEEVFSERNSGGCGYDINEADCPVSTNTDDSGGGSAAAAAAEGGGLEVFITWSGTDKNGKYLTSNEFRQSLYPSDSIVDFKIGDVEFSI